MDYAMIPISERKIKQNVEKSIEKDSFEIVKPFGINVSVTPKIDYMR